MSGYCEIALALRYCEICLAGTAKLLTDADRVMQKGAIINLIMMVKDTYHLEDLPPTEFSE